MSIEALVTVLFIGGTVLMLIFAFRGNNTLR
jgi:hypothetical protein